MIALIFGLDFYLPLGVAGGVPYIALILVGWWFPARQHIIALAAVASILTAVGYLVSPSGVIAWVVLTNRAYALFAIWVTAGILWKVRGSRDDGINRRDILLRSVEEKSLALEAANKELRSQIEERMRSEETFKRVFDFCPIGMALSDLSGRRIATNSALHRMLGYSSDELENMVFGDFTHPEDLDEDLGLFEELLTGEREFYDLEKRYIDKTGQLIWGHLFVTVIRDGSVPVSTISMVIDTTEQKRAEEQFLQAQKMEAIGQLTGGLAHDFNNLLAVMLGNVEILEDEIGENENTRNQLEAIKRSVNRGASLTSRLLAFSRKQTLSPVATNLSDLIAGLADLLRRTLGETVELRDEPSTDLWPATIDRHQFENALVNLSVNAKDAMPTGGTLTIEAANTTLDETYTEQYEEVVPGDYVMIAVSDNGTGMSSDVLEKVFEPFFTTKDVGEGSGLGLSMVYGFVKQSNGHITIYSEEGHGTTVKLYFPRSGVAVAEPNTSFTTPAIARGAGRILIVEDDPSVREVSAGVLAMQGYEVVEERDGKEALRHLKDGPPFDLLFTDLVLPGKMNGVEIAKQAKQIQPNIKILYTTGYAANAIINNNQLDPGVTLLNKPYRRAELLENVRALLFGSGD